MGPDVTGEGFDAQVIERKLESYSETASTGLDSLSRSTNSTGTPDG